MVTRVLSAGIDYPVKYDHGKVSGRTRMKNLRMTDEVTIYEFVGGETTFVALVEKFYEGVETDTVLRAMYPTELAAAKRHLALFLMQYFGGPHTYDQERGHPRLRMRHVGFVVDEDARDRWLHHMLAAVEFVNPPEPAKTSMVNYFISTANFLINQPRTIQIE